MHLGMATYNAQNPLGQNVYSVLNQKPMLLYVYYDKCNNKEHTIMEIVYQNMFIWLFINLIIEVVTSVIYSPTFIGPAASGLFIYYKSIYISLTQV